MQKHVYSHTDHLRIGDPCSSNTKKALISERLRELYSFNSKYILG